MKWLKLTKRIIEAFLFCVAGYLTNIALSRQLRYTDSIVIFVCAIIIVLNLIVDDILTKNE